MTILNRARWTIFRWPLLLANTIIGGLALGLLGDGAADVISLLLVGSPLAVIAVAIGRIRL